MELDIFDSSVGLGISTLPKILFAGWNLGQRFLEAWELKNTPRYFRTVKLRAFNSPKGVHTHLRQN